MTVNWGTGEFSLTSSVFKFSTFFAFNGLQKIIGYMERALLQNELVRVWYFRRGVLSGTSTTTPWAFREMCGESGLLLDDGADNRGEFVLGSSHVGGFYDLAVFADDDGDRDCPIGIIQLADVARRNPSAPGYRAWYPKQTSEWLACPPAR